MGWTTPRTFVTGELETAAIFNTHLRDNLNFLYGGGDAAVATGTATLVNDTYAAPTNYAGTGYGTCTVATNGITVGVAGEYMIVVTGLFVYSAGGGSRLNLLRKNGVGIDEFGQPACTKTNIQTAVSATFYTALVTNDRIDAQHRQDSGGSLASSSILIVKRLGA